MPKTRGNPSCILFRQLFCVPQAFFRPGLSRLNSRQPSLNSADLFSSLFPRFSLGHTLGNRGFGIPFVARASFRALRLPSASWSSLQTMTTDSSDDDMPLARPNGRCKSPLISILTFFPQFPNPRHILSARDCDGAYGRRIYPCPIARKSALALG